MVLEKEMTHEYNPKGVCSRKIYIEVEDDTVKDIAFVGGCSGNTQGVARLCVGKKTDEIINLLSGIKCGPKSTSCPDQLAQALKQIKAGND